MRHTMHIKTAVIILFFAISASSHAADWKEGQNYNEIAFPLPVETGKKIEVREFFWYGCPHCFRLEPKINKWLKNKPANSEFVRSPAILGPSWQLHAQVYFTYDLLGVVDKMHDVTFDAIHKDKLSLTTLEEFAELAEKHGVDKQQFLKTAQSFGVHVKMQQVLNLTRDAAVNAVPTIVVDGKYRTSEDIAGGKDNLMKLINYLVKKAGKERQKK